MQDFRKIIHLGIAALRSLSLLAMRSQLSVVCSLVILTSLCVLPLRGLAQALPNAVKSDEPLPDAPGIWSAAAAHSQSQTLGGTSALSGTVGDINGSTVSGARVTLVSIDRSFKRDAVSDALGRFSFSDLPPASYLLTIDSAGLRSFKTGIITLRAAESLDLPIAALPIATANVDVEVSASTAQVAQSQVKLAEQQRVLGIVPNFYSSYIWDAAPLTTRLKFDLAFRSTTDPVAFLLAGGVAGVEQSHNTFPGYGPGPEGYAKRYGAAYADNVIGRMVGSAVLPSLFHQDPRYFYRGKGSVKSRMLYAIGATFIARGDNGHLQPNYSHILGNFAAAGISNLYRTEGDRSASLTIRNGFIITGTNAIGNLVREFLLKSLTSKVPTFAQGQP